MSPEPEEADCRDWLAARTAAAPPPLRQRVLEHATAAPAGERSTLPEHLALAAERVLAMVEEHPGGRAIALDLLTADALITLALLAQAEIQPSALGDFAAGLLGADRIGQ
jgi:hypothetical protein